MITEKTTYSGLTMRVIDYLSILDRSSYQMDEVMCSVIDSLRSDTEFDDGCIATLMQYYNAEAKQHVNETLTELFIASCSHNDQYMFTILLEYIPNTDMSITDYMRGCKAAICGDNWRMLFKTLPLFKCEEASAVELALECCIHGSLDCLKILLDDERYDLTSYFCSFMIEAMKSKHSELAVYIVTDCNLHATWTEVNMAIVVKEVCINDCGEVITALFNNNQYPYMERRSHIELAAKYRSGSVIAAITELESDTTRSHYAVVICG